MKHRVENFIKISHKMLLQEILQVSLEALKETLEGNSALVIAVI